MKNSDPYVELAMNIKNQKTVAYEGYAIGTVVGSYPALRVAIAPNITIETEDLFVSSRLIQGYKQDVSLRPTSGIDIIGAIEYTENVLVDGAQVVMMPSQDGQSYVVLDLVVKV